MSRCWLALLVSVLGCAGGEPAQRPVAGPGDVVIYYTPFRFSSGQSVTAQSIATEYHCLFTIRKDSVEARTIQRVVGGAPAGPFKGDAVRMKAVGLDDSPIVIDAFGGVRETGPDRKLDVDSLAKIGILLDGVAKRQPCKI